jgi:hypothetical protein
MENYRLDADELAELRAARAVRDAYRINAVILLGNGWTAAKDADALLIDPDTARVYFKQAKGARLNYDKKVFR